MSAPLGSPQSPSLSWRVTSTTLTGMAGIVSKSFLFGLNRMEVTGLPGFLDILEQRRNVEGRKRGLITVSNHVSVLDDPLVWGVLPLKYLLDPSNLRYSLGAHDICFKTKLLAGFFSYGQVLPMHRFKHSPHGGLFQPTVAEAIRLLSSQPYKAIPTSSLSPTAGPLGSSSLSYSTDGKDAHMSPAAYLRNRHSWVHIFPEGMVHQHAHADLRYFKWGVARLILEAEPAPDVVAMFIDGTDGVMPEDRTFPRFLPRVGNRIRVAFGDRLDFDATFGDLRRRWQALAQDASVRGAGDKTAVVTVLGDLPDDLKYGKEAQEIRIEVARRLREEVLKVRQQAGPYPPSDPSFAFAETWAKDSERRGKKYRSQVDGSQVNQD